jgi:hypothetical protein
MFLLLTSRSSEFPLQSGADTFQWDAVHAASTKLGQMVFTILLFRIKLWKRQAEFAVGVTTASVYRVTRLKWEQRALIYIVWQASFASVWTHLLKSSSVIRHSLRFTEVISSHRTVVQFQSNRNSFYVRIRDVALRCFIAPKATRHVLLFLLFILKISGAWRTAPCSSFVLYYSTALVVLLFHLSWIYK